MEFAFLWFHVQMTLQKALEYLSDMCCVFLEGPRKNQTIIQVNKHKAVQHVSKYLGQTEGHHQVLIVTGGCVECGLPLIPMPDPHEMVSIPQVELGENGRSLEQLEGFGHEG